MNSMVYDLANEILTEIKKDFEVTYLSGNLRDTLKVYPTEDGITVEIPAQRYDIKKFTKEGVIIYTEGSYAQAVDEYGGFSKKHKDYVERAILKAIETVLRRNNQKGDVTLI